MITGYNDIAEKLRDRLLSLYPEQIEIIDESEAHAGHAGNNGGSHFKLHIVSAMFTGHNALARQRMVMEAAGDLMKGPIHALSIVAREPGETG